MQSILLAALTLFGVKLFQWQSVQEQWQKFIDWLLYLLLLMWHSVDFVYKLPGLVNQLRLKIAYNDYNLSSLVLQFRNHITWILFICSSSLIIIHLSPNHLVWSINVLYSVVVFFLETISLLISKLVLIIWSNICVQCKIYIKYSKI